MATDAVDGVDDVGERCLLMPTRSIAANSSPLARLNGSPAFKLDSMYGSLPCHSGSSESCFLQCSLCSDCGYLCA
jgi:hypothetical protein